VSFWKPLVVHGKPKGKSLAGKLGVAKRPGGAQQVTYQGKRLYTFTLDKPG
jgi:predicted lipoprotein with Yx(FWY)xxD motif